jgi:hypothetical protein
VRLDGLWAEEQRGCDLGVGLTVDDQPRNFELALRERGDADTVGFSRACASVDAMAQLSQFALCLVPVAQREARRSRPASLTRLA